MKDGDYFWYKENKNKSIRDKIIFMGIWGYLRRFVDRVKDTARRLSERYGLNVRPTAVALDQRLAGTGIGGYNSGGVIVVAPGLNEGNMREVADHETCHQLLRPDFISGIYGIFRSGYGVFRRAVVDISRIFAEADVTRAMVDDLGYRLGKIQGYHEIKEGLLEVGRGLSRAAGGARELYRGIREKGQHYLLELLQNNPHLCETLYRFVSRNYQKLGRYGMVGDLGSLAPYGVRC